MAIRLCKQDNLRKRHHDNKRQKGIKKDIIWEKEGRDRIMQKKIKT